MSVKNCITKYWQFTEAQISFNHKKKQEENSISQEHFFHQRPASADACVELTVIRDLLRFYINSACIRCPSSLYIVQAHASLVKSQSKTMGERMRYICSTT